MKKRFYNIGARLILQCKKCKDADRMIKNVKPDQAAVFT